MKTMLVLLILGSILVQAPAQDIEDQTFIQSLVRNLARYNWDVSETGALERYLYSYEWKNLNGADTELIAQALSYGKARGIEAPGDLAEIANQVALQTKEMLRLGLEPREIRRVCMNTIRTITTKRYAFENGQIPDMAQTFRDQISRQVAGAQESALRRQAERRVSQPEGADTWTPPTPEGRASGPPRPGGPVADSPVGNGGR